ncbi:MAG: heme exporter protein CcmB [Candidatus Bathyarchaeia archaeon]
MEQKDGLKGIVSFLADVWEILLKDLRLEMRRRYEIHSVLIFALLSNLLFAFAIGPSNPNVREFVPAVLWMSILFISILCFATVFIREMDKGTLDGLRLAPISAQAVLAGKTLYTFALMSLGTVLIVPSSMIILNYTFNSDGLLVVFVLVLGILDLSIVGSTVSSLTMYSESRGLMIPALSLPLIPGTLIPSILATGKLAVGATPDAVLPEIQLNLGYLLLFSAALWITFEYVLYD